jgi:hypothetical protein
MSKALTLAKVVLAILCIVCLLRMPYDYYTFFRFFAMAIFIILAIESYKEKGASLVVIWLISALLVNPIIKVPLGRLYWNVVDVIWAVILIGSMFYTKKTVRDA